MADTLETLFKQITHGVYVVGVCDGKTQNAFTAAWVMQVSFDPLMLAFSINKNHYSYELLKVGEVCTINVLGQDQQVFAEHFGRSDIRDKMTGFVWQEGKTCAPVLAESLVYFDCKVSHYADAGDHKIAICNVLDAARLNSGEPLRYNETGDMDGSQDLFPDNIIAGILQVD